MFAEFFCWFTQFKWYFIWLTRLLNLIIIIIIIIIIIQCNNGETGEGTWLANHRNNLFATKIRRQQGSQQLPTHYMLNNHVQNPDRNNSHKNFHTFERAELTTSGAKRMSPWNWRLQGSINYIRSVIGGLQVKEQEFKYSLNWLLESIWQHST